MRLFTCDKRLPSSSDNWQIRSVKADNIIKAKGSTFYNLLTIWSPKGLIGRSPIIGHVAYRKRIVFTRSKRLTDFRSYFPYGKKIVFFNNESSFFTRFTEQRLIKRLAILDMSTEHTPASITTSKYYFGIINRNAHDRSDQFSRRQFSSSIQLPADVFTPATANNKFFAFFVHTTIITKVFVYFKQHNGTYVKGGQL